MRIVDVGRNLLEMRGISKWFPGVRALYRVNFSCEAGEVHALVGENGAGKSTLMKILGGAYAADEGEILLDGRKVSIRNPLDAQRLGIGVVYQEFTLFPHLSVAENIFVGKELFKGPFLDYTRMARKSEELLSSLGFSIDPLARVCDLGVAQQQVVEICKIIVQECRLVVMDEPSACLTERELERLFELIRRLKGRGVAIIYISHRLDEIFQIADRVTVLKDGEVVGTASPDRISKNQLIEMMVGRKVAEIYPSKRSTENHREVLLSVRGLTWPGRVNNVSFDLYKGEILGIAGLVGSGRTELAQALFGLAHGVTGDIFVNGRKVVVRSPAEAAEVGLALVTEDRKSEGICLRRSVRENVSLAWLRRRCRFGFLPITSEKKLVRDLISRLRIVCAGEDVEVQYLSGGNQQKVVLAKWLATEPMVLILDEPTRGIDVGAKVEIYTLIRRLADAGLGIIMISSELPEVLGMSDRILVMRNGTIVGELSAKEATEGRVLSYAFGVGGTVDGTGTDGGTGSW